MKIAIPCESALGVLSERSGNFENAPYFTIVEFDGDMNIAGTEPVTNLDYEEFGLDGIVRFMIALEAGGILVSGMDMTAFRQFTDAGVTVYIEGSTPNVGDVARLFAEGKVPRMSAGDASPAADDGGSKGC